MQLLSYHIFKKVSGYHCPVGVRVIICALLFLGVASICASNFFSDETTIKVSTIKGKQTLAACIDPVITMEQKEDTPCNREKQDDQEYIT